jgi:hypothetical protein
MGSLSIPPLQMPMLAPAGPMLTPIGPASSREVHVHTHMSVTVNAQAWDGTDAERAFERHILPRLKHELTYNNNRLASVVKRAIKE